MELTAMDRVASLFVQHGDAVHAYAQARAGSALAADIVSDTFVSHGAAETTLPTPRCPGSWRPHVASQRPTYARRSVSRV